MGGHFPADEWLGVDAKSIGFIFLVGFLLAGSTGMWAVWTGQESEGFALLLLCAGFAHNVEEWLVTRLLWGDEWVYTNWLYRAGWTFSVKSTLIKHLLCPLLLFTPFILNVHDERMWLLIVFYMNDQAATGAWQFGLGIAQDVAAPGMISGVLLTFPAAIFASYRAWNDLDFSVLWLYGLWCCNFGLVAGQFDVWYKASPNHHKQLKAKFGPTQKNPYNSFSSTEIV